MSIETSLHYQQQFFNNFATAWQNKSRYHLYQGIDATVTNLRLDAQEVPGYILAYDKVAQVELHDFLQIGFIAFLRDHIPFFEISDDGQVFFGNWYHRRQFGRINVIQRTIEQVTEEQRVILPQLESFAEDPDHYLDRQLDAMRKEVYRDVDTLHSQIETLAAEAPIQEQAQESGSGFRGLLKNFIDPEEQTDTPKQRPGQNSERLKERFNKAKLIADDTFDKQKREIQVASAVTRYEYQAVLEHYKTVEEFENVLTNLKDDFMTSLKREGGAANA